MFEAYFISWPDDKYFKYDGQNCLIFNRVNLDKEYSFDTKLYSSKNDVLNYLKLNKEFFMRHNVFVGSKLGKCSFNQQNIISLLNNEPDQLITIDSISEIEELKDL